MTNQIIRRYQIEGMIRGTNLIQTREAHRLTILGMMRDDGFVPVLDIDPIFEIKWVGDDRYEFCYTWQAVHVGKEKAWQTEGISGGRMIPSTPKNK